MACPRCGNVCHCSAGVRTPERSQPRPRFELDSQSSSPASAVLVDPEQYEATEEQFSASLERPAVSPPRFVPDAPAAVLPQVCAEPEPSPTAESPTRQVPDSAVSSEKGTPAPSSEKVTSACSDQRSRDAVAPAEPAPPSANPDAWKEELAARLSSYRAKRKPRPPKYPSLSLDFEPSFPPSSPPRSPSPDVRTALAVEEPAQNFSLDTPAQKVRLVPPEEEVAQPLATAPTSARVIEFPRFFAPAEPSPDQLAEPICEQPRILDAPEVEMPAPALGGIVLESKNDDAEAEERPGFEVPLRSASISRRVVAAVVDMTVMLSAAVMFACIFLQLVKVLPPVTSRLASAALVIGTLWAGYHYLLLTYSGTTPGLRFAKLQLAHFDGSPVLRSTRRWRVLASLLSAVSLGLGFAWCFLDEDGLCWHDRITRTHLEPRA